MELLVLGVFIGIGVLALRLFGAWMLRITDILNNQKELMKFLRDNMPRKDK